MSGSGACDERESENRMVAHWNRRSSTEAVMAAGQWKRGSGICGCLCLEFWEFRVFGECCLGFGFRADRGSVVADFASCGEWHGD